jgi:STE24 endopeptidase
MRWATLVGAGLVWLVAAWLLWRTRIPGDLSLPDLAERDYFTAGQLREAERFERFLRVSWLLATVSSFVALWVMSRRAPRMAREIGLGRVGTAVIIGMVTLVVLWAVGLPFTIVDWWWQRRHDLVKGSLLEVLITPWASLTATALLGMLFIAIIVGFANRWPRGWWALVVPVFAAISLVFVIAQFLLIPFDTHALDDPRLQREADRLERIVGAEGTPVEVQEMSDFTTQANAYAYRLGPLKRVVLWDTLLDGRFTDGEVHVVVAHELAHVAREHVLKGFGWFLLISLPLWWLIARIVDRRGGVGDPANLPYTLIVIALLSLAFTPFGNVVSRRYESEADWVALEATRDPASARGLFEGFATTSLADPDPPVWAHLLLDTHPSLLDRIAMAEAWRATRGAESPAAP